MQSHVTSVMDVWKSLYETANIHMGLVVKEMNLCAELMCSDLYSAYGQYVSELHRFARNFEIQFLSDSTTPFITCDQIFPTLPKEG